MPHFTGRHGDSGEIETAIKAPAITVAGAVSGLTATISNLLSAGTISSPGGVTVTKTMTAGTIAITGAISGGAAAAVPSATTIPAFGTNQAYVPVSVGGTTYRILLWLNA